MVQQFTELLARECLLIPVQFVPIGLRSEGRELRRGPRQGNQKDDREREYRSHVDFLNAFAPSCYKKDS